MSGSSSRIVLAASSPSTLWVGRHPDVDDHEIRDQLPDQPEQRLGVAGLPDDREPGPVQQARQPRPEQHVVVGEDHPQRRPAGSSGADDPVAVPP